MVAKVRETLAKKDDTEPEEIKRQTNELQQASLKLFEMAYKKVRDLFVTSFWKYTLLNSFNYLQMAAEREGQGRNEQQQQQQQQQEDGPEKKEEKN